MSTTGQPIVTSHNGKRQFICSPAAVLAFVVDDRERILMLSNPKSGGRWEVVNGALNGGETVLEGVLREVREEAGTDLRVHPLGVIHTYTYPYDKTIQHMISIAYLLAYEGGLIIPGDDMEGSEFGWFSVEQIESGEITTLVPSELPWLFRRAIALYRMVKDHPPRDLEPELDDVPALKYPKERIPGC